MNHDRECEQRPGGAYAGRDIPCHCAAREQGRNRAIREQSRYRRQREEAGRHPNRKQKLKPYHDTDRPYEEVSGQIEDAIERFKKGQQR